MWNFCDMVRWTGFPLLDAILFLHRSLGLMSELSQALLLSFSPLLRSVLNTMKLALPNFLECQTVHRFLSVHSLWFRRFYGTFSSWLDYGYPLVEGLRASSGRGLCLLRSVDSLYSERLGVPGLLSPHGSRHSCLVVTKFPLCGCSSLQSGRRNCTLVLPVFLVVQDV